MNTLQEKHGVDPAAGAIGDAAAWASLESMEGIASPARDWYAFNYRDFVLSIGTESAGKGGQRFVFNHPTEWDDKNNRPKRIRRQSQAAIELEARNVIDRELDHPAQPDDGKLNRLRQLRQEAESLGLSPELLSNRSLPSLKNLPPEMRVACVLAGESLVTSAENKTRDAKAMAYDAIAEEAAKIGRTDEKSVLELWRAIVTAQMKLGLGKSLLVFLLHALEVLVTPVIRHSLRQACLKFEQHMKARNDINIKGRRTLVWDMQKFTAAMDERVRERKTKGQFEAPPAEIHVDEVESNDIQQWLNDYGASAKRRRDLLDEARAFLVYCRDELHATPPALKTAAHAVPRPKPAPDSQRAPILVFRDVWRIIINLQDLESVWFFAIELFAGLLKTEILRLDWEYDIVWEENRPVRLFVASENSKETHGGRTGQFVDIRFPLNKILALGYGRAGKICLRKNLADEKLARLAARLKTPWDGNIIRRTFASNLLGLGFGVEEVARNLRHPVTGLRPQYLPKPEAQQFFTLPLGMDHFANLPRQERFWKWGSLHDIEVQSDGTSTIIPIKDEPLPDSAEGRQGRPKRVLKKREKRIEWDDLQLQVALWEKTQSDIGRELGCRQTTVSQHVTTRHLLRPKSDYFERLKHGLPVEIPEVVIKAREALLARENASTPKAGESSAPSQSAPDKAGEENPTLTGGSGNVAPNAGFNLP
jgi:hypothetical protein